MKVLDKERVHKIEVFEMKLNEEQTKNFVSKNIDFSKKSSNVFCEVDGIAGCGKIDIRGKRSKFWIGDGKNPYAYLVKYNERSVKTEENAGQFLMCGLLEQLNIPHAQYLVAEFSKDDKNYDAIISKNYREKESYIELSGATLNQNWEDRMYDNNFGEKKEHCHTVEHYYKILKMLYDIYDIDFDQIRFELLKYCLIQYIFNMSDLHYYNLSFSYDSDIGRQTLKLNPYYDCGNICALNFSDRKIRNNAEQYSKSRNNKAKEKFIRNLIHSNMPLFGVKTDICYIYQTQSLSYTCRPKCEQYKDKEVADEAESNLQILQQELAEEIYKNKDLYSFYQEIKNLDIDKAAQKYNKIKESTIPSYCVDLVKAVKTETQTMLDNALLCLSKKHEEKLEEDKISVDETETIKKDGGRCL